jgi:hypothetical protein
MNFNKLHYKLIYVKSNAKSLWYGGTCEASKTNLAFWDPKLNNLT